jgi:hypothetical protein
MKRGEWWQEIRDEGRRWWQEIRDEEGKEGMGGCEGG